MKRATTKISKLVQDMLAVSKEREPEREPLDLTDLLNSILQECGDKANETGVELISNLASVQRWQPQQSKRNPSLRSAPNPLECRVLCEACPEPL